MSNYYHWYDWISEPKTVTITLTADQQQILLRLHDYGIGAIDDDEKLSELYTIVQKLKDEVHP